MERVWSRDNIDIASLVLSIMAIMLISVLFIIPATTTSPTADARQMEKTVFVDYSKKAQSGNGRNIDLCGDGSNKYTYLSGMIKWSELPVPYYVDTSGFSSDSVSAEQAEAAVVAAFDTWDNADKPDKQFFIHASDVNDAKITISWRSLDGANNVLASTAVIYLTDTKEILFSNIVLDSDEDWFIGQETDTCENIGSAFDIQNVLTHEVGHAIGLGHVNHPALTMYPFVSPGELYKKSLGLGDRNGFNKLE